MGMIFRKHFLERSQPSGMICTAMQTHTDISFSDAIQDLLPKGLQLIPQINELYELRLALLESQTLDQEGIIERGAYFGSVDGTPTHHFMLCAGVPLQVANSGEKRKNFFKNNIFRTGYATHGFFPYRGKFHPQMVKALLNIMGLKPGDTVLDPMMGSGTTIVEACTIGINGIGVDVSPFCDFMARVKIESLTANTEELKELCNLPVMRRHIYEDFKRNISQHFQNGCLDTIRRIAALAYFDVVGFTARSSRMGQEEAFEDILLKYGQAIFKFQEASSKLNKKIGHGETVVGDARSLQLPSDSIDGILFSPPYSFAVDYVENDIPQLRLLGTDVKQLRNSMVGLRGKRGAEQVLKYVEDISIVLNECYRVLKRGKCCVIIVGTNSKQLDLLRERHQLHDLEQSLEELFIHRAVDVGLKFLAEVPRQVMGIANSLREESILIFQKPFLESTWEVRSQNNHV